MKFAELKAADYKSPTVALFWGLNCNPCEQLKPRLREVCDNMGVRLEEFQVATEMEAAKELNLRAVPTVLVVHKGEVKTAFFGLQSGIREKLLAAGVIEK